MRKFDSAASKSNEITANQVRQAGQERAIRSDPGRRAEKRRVRGHFGLPRRTRALALNSYQAVATVSITMRGMAAAAFDTFQAARALESAGVDRAQAEAIAEAIRLRPNYATKSDLAELRAELRGDMASLETRLTNRIYAVANGLDLSPERMPKW